MYGIFCDGGPKSRSIRIGMTSTEQQSLNNGRIFFIPDESNIKGYKWVYSNTYPFKTKKEAEGMMKVARKARLDSFLSYDGFSKCKIESGDKPK